MTCQTSSKAPTQSFAYYHVFWVAADIPSPHARKVILNKQIFKKWSENYSAKVDILGRLQDILWIFNNSLKKNTLIQNVKRTTIVYLFQLPMPNQTLIELFTLLN